MVLIKNADLRSNWLDVIKDSFTDMNIPRDELKKFRTMLSGLSMDTGEHLVREGNLPQKLAFVVSGIFRAYYLTESGNEKTIVFRGRGKPLSAYSSFLKDEPAKFSIQALEKSIVLYITIQDFERLLSGDPSWKIVTGQYYMKPRVRGRSGILAEQDSSGAPGRSLKGFLKGRRRPYFL